MLGERQVGSLEETQTLKSKLRFICVVNECGEGKKEVG